MTSYCKIISLADTSKGMVAILEFSDGIIPHIGMLLRKSNDLEIWKIIGVGMPTLFRNIKITSTYNSDAVWDCLLETLTPAGSLKEGDELNV